ncbi:transposable element tc3 transposase [Lasius niger]|uniref:Transposable element tc3 transposase n=1 Tax=Lasius niger TaxID=67767 RepID=A0A0J7JZU6_LASNI|nr:transposable element tc3 transposase [Lasius niger]
MIDEFVSGVDMKKDSTVPVSHQFECLMEARDGLGRDHYNPMGDLVVMLPPGMTAVRYINEILRPHVLPFRERIGDQFILMHDNASPYTAALTREFLQNPDITVLDHPTISPDLNPIEHIWDLIGRELRHRPRQPTTLAELERVLQEIWQKIPQIEISRCINIRED